MVNTASGVSRLTTSFIVPAPPAVPRFGAGSARPPVASTVIVSWGRAAELQGGRHRKRRRHGHAESHPGDRQHRHPGGGGIASATFDPASVAKLTLNNSAVTGNSQTAPPPDSLGGGGIVNILGTVTLNSSRVNNNIAQGFVGGGIASGDYLNFSETSSFLTLNNSQVDGNTSLNGGGISSGPGPGNGGQPGPATSQLVLSKSEVNGNTATAPVPQPGAEEVLRSLPVVSRMAATPP